MCLLHFALWMQHIVLKDIEFKMHDLGFYFALTQRGIHDETLKLLSPVDTYSQNEDLWIYRQEMDVFTHGY